MSFAGIYLLNADIHLTVVRTIAVIGGLELNLMESNSSVSVVGVLSFQQTLLRNINKYVRTQNDYRIKGW